MLYHRLTRLPLDNCLHGLRRTIPHYSRSALHRCLRKHGISRLPELEGGRPGKWKGFEDHPAGSFHVDTAKASTGEGRLQLFAVIDRTCKHIHAEAHGKKSTAAAAEFPCNLVAAVPYRFHMILPDIGVRFTSRGRDRRVAAAHVFEKIGGENGIEHRLTKVYRPWTNGQVERINRTFKRATVKRHYHYAHKKFREHPGKFLTAHNFARRFNALRGRTPL